MTGQTVLEGKDTKIRVISSVMRSPRRWGRWFRPIGDATLRQTNLNIFFQFGLEIGGLAAHISAETTVSEFYTRHWLVFDWLTQFLEQVKGLPFGESRAAAMNIAQCFADITREAPTEWGRKLTLDEVRMLLSELDEFGKALERDHQNLSVFTVTPKGIYDTHALLETPEYKFSQAIRRVLPPQLLDDFKQAARCLAFEIPTACAFHVCRGTEALIIEYHERLSGHPWNQPRRDWGIYIDHLVKDGAPEKITSRLREIAKMDRNAYIHPDINVSLDEAPLLFDLCAAVIFYMGQELEGLASHK